MIILDTHVWLWWVDGGERLPSSCRRAIESHVSDGLGVCAISIWEVAKLVERGRLMLNRGVHEWCVQALAYPGISLLPLTPEVSIESTRLGTDFVKDPADQIIVATARIFKVPLLTLDERLLNHPGVPTLR